jgi:energy-coupling factor transporter ATP-binding protein EcfA2
LVGDLTVRETLRLSHRLRVKSESSEERERHIDSVLSELGLTRVADSRIGDEKNRGLSGGERKRVSIGVELITSPSLLFLDEPTTGLDAASALALCELLATLRSRGRTIIYTIHQPRSNIIPTFDRIALLARGRMVFTGTSQGAIDFFAAQGHPVPPLCSPSDFFMDVIDRPEAALALAGAFERLRSGAGEGRVVKEVGGIQAVEGMGTMVGKRVPHLGFSSSYGSGFFFSTLCLLQRNLISAVRNPALFWMQLMQSTVFGLLVGSLWSNLSASTKLQSQLSALFFVCTYTSMSCFAAAPFLIEARGVFVKERLSGSYRASAYLLAKTIADLPLYSMIAVAFGGIVWKLARLDENFPFFLLVVLVHIQSSAAVVVFVSALSPSIDVAMVLATFINGLSTIFSGFLVPYGSIPKYFRWIYTGSYIQLASSALTVNQFENGDAEARLFLSDYVFEGSHVPDKWRCLLYSVIFAVTLRFLAYLALRFRKLM